MQQHNVRNQHLSRTMTSIKNMEPSSGNADRLGPLANIKALFKYILINKIDSKVCRKFNKTKG